MSKTIQASFGMYMGKIGLNKKPKTKHPQNQKESRSTRLMAIKTKETQAAIRRKT